MRHPRTDGRGYEKGSFLRTSFMNGPLHNSLKLTLVALISYENLVDKVIHDIVLWAQQSLQAGLALRIDVAENFLRLLGLVLVLSKPVTHALHCEIYSF